MVSWELALEPTVQSAKRGRDLVQRLLCDADPDCVETVVILTDELVANAVTHGRPPIMLVVNLDRSSVNVAVTDAGPGLPILRPVPRIAESGRGLVIVDVLSDQWGVDPLPAGKRVWFRMTAGPLTGVSVRGDGVRPGG
jgi:anti-sigma regulatory factor (Ser/Thr protein kinase)